MVKHWDQYFPTNKPEGISEDKVAFLNDQLPFKTPQLSAQTFFAAGFSRSRNSVLIVPFPMATV